MKLTADYIQVLNSYCYHQFWICYLPTFYYTSEENYVHGDSKTHQNQKYANAEQSSQTSFTLPWT